MAKGSAKLSIEVDTSDLSKLRVAVEGVADAQRQMREQTKSLGRAVAKAGKRIDEGAKDLKGMRGELSSLRQESKAVVKAFGSAVGAALTVAAAKEAWEQFRDSYEYMLYSIGPRGEKIWEDVERRMRSVRAELSRFILGTDDINVATDRMNALIDETADLVSAMGNAFGPLLQGALSATTSAMGGLGTALNALTGQYQDLAEAEADLRQGLIEGNRALEESIDKLGETPYTKFIQETRELDRAYQDFGASLTDVSQVSNRAMGLAVQQIREQRDELTGLSALANNLGIGAVSVAEEAQAAITRQQVEFQAALAQSVQSAARAGRLSYVQLREGNRTVLDEIIQETAARFEFIEASAYDLTEVQLRGISVIAAREQELQQQALDNMRQRFSAFSQYLGQFEPLITGVEPTPTTEPDTGRGRSDREQREREAADLQERIKSKQEQLAQEAREELQSGYAHTVDLVTMITERTAAIFAAGQQGAAEQALILKENESARLAALRQQADAELQIERDKIAAIAELEKQSDEARAQERKGAREAVLMNAVADTTAMFQRLATVEKQNADGTRKSAKELAKERKAILLESAGDFAVAEGNKLIAAGIASLLIPALQPLGAKQLAGGVALVAAGTGLGSTAKALKGGSQAAPEREDSRRERQERDTRSTIVNANFGVVGDARATANLVQELQNEANRAGFA